MRVAERLGARPPSSTLDLEAHVAPGCPSSIASAWCGFAVNVRQLILARAAQGIGGALLVPGSLAIIGAAFRGEDRGRPGHDGLQGDA